MLRSQGFNKDPPRILCKDPNKDPRKGFCRDPLSSQWPKQGFFQGIFGDLCVGSSRI